MVGVCMGVACNIVVANLTLPLLYVLWDPVVQLCTCVHMCNSLIILEESFFNNHTPCLICSSGKSTTLRNVFSILGAEHHITGPDTHPAVIVSRAAGTTVPLGIYDVRSAKKAETISVQFFNGFSHHTCENGEQKPCTSVIITSNSTFCNSEK